MIGNRRIPPFVLKLHYDRAATLSQYWYTRL